MDRYEFLELTGFRSNAITEEQTDRLLKVFQQLDISKAEFCRTISIAFLLLIDGTFDRVFDSAPLQVQLSAIDGPDAYGLLDMIKREADKQLEKFICFLEEDAGVLTR
jgi:hypothetical protein